MLRTVMLCCDGWGAQWVVLWGGEQGMGGAPAGCAGHPERTKLFHPRGSLTGGPDPYTMFLRRPPSPAAPAPTCSRRQAGTLRLAVLIASRRPGQKTGSVSRTTTNAFLFRLRVVMRIPRQRFVAWVPEKAAGSRARRRALARKAGGVAL